MKNQITMARALVAAALLTNVGCVFATEGGAGVYPNGNENFLVAAMPPPGVYALEYLVEYDADKLKDNDGNDVPLDFKVAMKAAATRLVWVTEQKPLGGQLSLGLIASLVDVRTSFFGQEQHKSGLGDLIFEAGWGFHASEKLHYAFAVDVTAPTAQYDKNSLANIGRNYWNIEPVAALTYVQPRGINADLKVMVDFNGRNKDTNYTSGQELHADYALGWGFGNGWVAGVGGFLYQQTSDDKVSGMTVQNNHGHAMSIGPSIKYQAANGLFVTAKFEKEYGVKNRAEGTSFKVKLLLPLAF